MSLAHVKEALPKLVRQCPEGEIRQLLQLAEERLHGLERTGPVVRVSKADLLRALGEELPDEVERSTVDHAAIALLNREQPRQERFDIRLAELSKRRIKRESAGPSALQSSGVRETSARARRVRPQYLTRAFDRPPE